MRPPAGHFLEIYPAAKKNLITRVLLRQLSWLVNIFWSIQINLPLIFRVQAI